MEAGDLDRRVTILDYSWDETDEFGSPIISYTPVGTVWAKRTDLSDSERVAAYGVVASVVTRFLVRSSELTRSINPADRLDHDGKDKPTSPALSRRRWRLAWAWSALPASS